MKNIKVLMFLLITVSACNYKTEHKKSEMPEADKKETITNQLRHVVLFKFKETSEADDIKQIETAFLALPKKIKEITAFEWGLNNSPENLNKGFTHCYFLTFKSEEDRAIYLIHPDHLAFGELLTPHIEDVLVVDYWTL